jgi:hypothetical protein
VGTGGLMRRRVNVATAVGTVGLDHRVDDDDHMPAHSPPTLFHVYVERLAVSSSLRSASDDPARHLENLVHTITALYDENALRQVQPTLQVELGIPNIQEQSCIRYSFPFAKCRGLMSC